MKHLGFNIYYLFTISLLIVAVIVTPCLAESKIQWGEVQRKALAKGIKESLDLNNQSEGASVDALSLSSKIVRIKGSSSKPFLDAPKLTFSDWTNGLEKLSGQKPRDHIKTIEQAITRRFTKFIELPKLPTCKRFKEGAIPLRRGSIYREKYVNTVFYDKKNPKQVAYVKTLKSFKVAYEAGKTVNLKDDPTSVRQAMGLLFGIKCLPTQIVKQEYLNRTHLLYRSGIPTKKQKKRSVRSKH